MPYPPVDRPHGTPQAHRDLLGEPAPETAQEGGRIEGEDGAEQQPRRGIVEQGRDQAAGNRADPARVCTAAKRSARSVCRPHTAGRTASD